MGPRARPTAARHGENRPIADFGWPPPFDQTIPGGLWELGLFSPRRFCCTAPVSRCRPARWIDEALIDFEEARICALSVFPPQSANAVAATMPKAKLLGLIIDRQEVGSSQDYEFEKARTREELLNMLHERLGPAAVERFKKFVSKIKEIPVIELKIVATEMMRATSGAHGRIGTGHLLW